MVFITWLSECRSWGGSLAKCGVDVDLVMCLSIGVDGCTHGAEW